MKKLAIIVSHPIQYYSPWFQYLTKHLDWDLQVFYLWDFGVTQQLDRGFQQSIQWDLPLLAGYTFEFVPNISTKPGTYHWGGMQNPTLLSRVSAYAPDVVLMMNYNYRSCYQFLLRWPREQVPLLFRGDSHRLVPSGGRVAWLKRQVITQIFRCFAACLYVGSANYQYFQYHGVDKTRLFFSPHAVDNDRFMDQLPHAHQDAIAWKQALGIPDHHLTVLFAGKFEAKKRPLDLLRAFLQANLPNVSLLFVGAGPLEADLKSAALGCTNIYFAPFQNQTLMPRTYRAADLVVLPSYGPQETWGLAINEAMCLARPVLTSTHVGCAQDLIRPHHNGLVFKAGDVDHLARCLQEACADREQLHQWGQASLALVSNYSYIQATQGLQQALAFVGGNAS